MAKRESLHYRYRQFEFWAEDGMIVLVDTNSASNSSSTDTQERQYLRPGQFLARAMAIRVTIGDDYPSDAFQARMLLDRAQTVCKLAKQQGTGLNRQRITELPSDIAPKKKAQIIVPGMPGYANAGGIQAPGLKQRVRSDNPDDIMRHGPHLELDTSLIIP